MFFGIAVDDVVDTSEVQNTLTDWFRQAGTIALVIFIALIVLNFLVGILIAKKAGYSGWWGFLAILLMPVGIGSLMVLIFSMLKWPALKERDEALGLLREHNISLPSHERAAIREAERKRDIEEQARRNMEKAQAERVKAEAAKAKFAASQPAPAAPAEPASPPASEADARADKSEAKKATPKTKTQPQSARKEDSNS